MQINIDWKFIVMAILGIAGILVSLFIWREDQTAFSIQVKTVSQTMLQPIEGGAISGLKVLIDDQPLELPFLTVVEIDNNGLKPILATSFETPLEIRFKENVNIARAQVTSTNPKSIEPVLSFDKGTLSIKPLLLNPGDTMTIAIVTSGGVPDFSVITRIANISSADVVDSRTDENKSNSKARWIGLILALGLMLIYALVFPAGRQQTQLNKRTSWIVAVIAMLSVTALLARFNATYSSWQAGVVILILYAIASIIAVILNPRPK